jgi:hypothetical protein
MDLTPEAIKEIKQDLTMTETGEKGPAEDEAAATESESATESVDAGSAKSESASAGSGEKEGKAEIREGKGAGGMTDSKYFWPAVGVGSVALIGGVYFFFFRGK